MNARSNLTHKNRKGSDITLKEYGTLCRNPAGAAYGYQCIDESVFDRLERFILENRADGKGTEALELMTVASRKGIGKIISAKNYVGVIAMAEGTRIEILPKLYTGNEEISMLETKRIFLHMLKTIGDIPGKVFRHTDLDAGKNHILDLFIRMFIDEAVILVKRGLKSDYREHRDNERFYKGKLRFAEHIKHNAAHKERFYIEFDEFSVDRPENRLVKTTIELLKKMSRSPGNRKDLHILSAAFDQVEISKQPEKDWAGISLDRTTQEYRTLLEWCRLFLSGLSFTPFKGDNNAYALLFPMEKIYERYVAKQLKKRLSHPDIRVKTQDRTHRLFQTPARFQLKPDIVAQGPAGVAVLDTKWKILSRAKDYGISQADMYQAYAYGKKYGAGRVYLLYPGVPQMPELEPPIVYDSGDGVEVRVVFLDLGLGTDCVSELAEELRHWVLSYIS